MDQFKQPPISRSQALQPFSRDHYQGLVQAQHLIKAADADDVERRKILSEFLDAWAQEIAEHFADEERLLLEHLDDVNRERLLGEHAAVRGLVEAASEQRRQINPDADLLRQLGQMLNDHIRWEERELFTHIEKKLGEDGLAVMAPQTEQMESRRHRGRH